MPNASRLMLIINKLSQAAQQTCGGRAGSMGGFLWQVEDLLAGIWRGSGVLALSGLHRVVLLPVVVCVEELLEPLNEVQVVLKSSLDELLYREDLRGNKM